jgi:hypothetical protein
MAAQHAEVIAFLSLWTLWLLVTLPFLLAGLPPRVIMAPCFLASLTLLLLIAGHVTWRAALMAWLAIHAVFALSMSRSDRRQLCAVVASLSGLAWVGLQGGGGYAWHAERGQLAFAICGAILLIFQAWPALVADHGVARSEVAREMGKAGEWRAPWPQSLEQSPGGPHSHRPVSRYEQYTALGEWTAAIFSARQPMTHSLASDEQSRSERREEPSHDRGSGLSTGPLTPALKGISPTWLAGHTSRTSSPAIRPTSEALFAERLRLYVIEERPSPASTRNIRIVIERDVAQLPMSVDTGLSNASVAINHARVDTANRQRLAEATSDYLTGKFGDPVFSTVTQWWVTRNTYPEIAVADALNSVNDILTSIITAPIKTAASALQIPQPAGL